jgi:FkbM family methyltransferase
MNTFLIKARTLARKTGLIKIINRLRPERPYEDRFHQALVAAVRKGDVVWDVGANVGLYTEMFCEWTGPQGLVVAFEPSKESVAKIKEQIPDCAWLRIENAALAEQDAIGKLVLAESSVNHRLESVTDAARDDVKTDTVTISRGDTVCERMGRVPNVIKIDVESFEEEVLKGLDHTLLSPELRSVLVEIHFSQLEARGQANAPVRIEKLLRSKGFKLAWLDASHLEAKR